MLHALSQLSQLGKCRQRSCGVPSRLESCPVLKHAGHRQREQGAKQMDGCAGLHDTSRSPAPSQQEQLENLANLQHLAQQGGVPDVPASDPCHSPLLGATSSIMSRSETSVLGYCISSIGIAVSQVQGRRPRHL